MAGFHYRFSVNVGASMGHKVAEQNHPNAATAALTSDRLAAFETSSLAALANRCIDRSAYRPRRVLAAVGDRRGLEDGSQSSNRELPTDCKCMILETERCPSG